MQIKDLEGKKIAILGFGINNQALTFWLLKKGISLTICDQNPKIQEQSLKQASASEKLLLDIVREWRVGETFLNNLTDFDLVFRTPGLPYLTSEIQSAKKAGVLVSSQTELFLQLAPGLVIGVTGTKGKSTTAAMIAHLLENGKWKMENGKKGKVFLAGNIGRDPFEFFDELKTEDVVVLELSSFQLQGITVSPKIAVITPITSDHLDHHQTDEEYIEAKKGISAHQRSNDFLVINVDEKANRVLADQAKSQVSRYSIKQKLNTGAYIRVGESGLLEAVVQKAESVSGEVIGREGESLAFGRPALENWCAAAALGYFIFKIKAGDCRKLFSSFPPLPHRLEFLGQVQGALIYNDSYSTNPASTIAAILSFHSPLILISGGSSKNADFSQLATTILESRVKSVLTIGEEGQKIIAAIAQQKKDRKLQLIDCQNLAKAFSQALALMVKNDSILFSPACASFDQFKNATDRGETFKKLVNDQQKS